MLWRVHLAIGLHQTASQYKALVLVKLNAQAHWAWLKLSLCLLVRFPNWHVSGCHFQAQEQVGWGTRLLSICSKCIRLWSTCMLEKEIGLVPLLHRRFRSRYRSGQTWANLLHLWTDELQEKKCNIVWNTSGCEQVIGIAPHVFPPGES